MTQHIVLHVLIYLVAICSTIDASTKRKTSPPPSTQSPVAPVLPPLASSDLTTWQAFYNATSGTQWVKCSTNRDTPCACSGVTCNVVQGRLRITALNLHNYRLRGNLSPMQLYGFSALVGPLDFSSSTTNTKSTFANILKVIVPQSPTGLQACLYLPFSCTATSTCTFKRSGVQSCASSAEISPTFMPTFPPSTTQPTTTQPSIMSTNALDVASFNLLQVSMPGWIDCGTVEDSMDPCTRCPQRVTCQHFPYDSQLRIVTLNLTHNGLTGTPPPGDELFGRGGLTRMVLFDLSYNPNLVVSSTTTNTTTTSSSCFNYPECHYHLQCISWYSGSFTFCDSISPPPTNQPTTQPTLPTLSPTAIPSLQPTTMITADLFAWQNFYDDTGGPNWLSCRQFRNDPCSCSDPSRGNFILCGNSQSSLLRIQMIVLNNNNMTGMISSSTLTSMSALRTLSLKSTTTTPTTPNLFHNPQCLTIPQCMLPGAMCDLSGSGDTICATTPPPIPLVGSDYDAFMALYTATNGPSWTYCNDANIDPCNTTTCGDFFKHRIVCETINSQLRLVELKLPQNNMRGVVPSSALLAMTALNILELESDPSLPNPNVFFNEDCVNLPKCHTPLMYCDTQGSALDVCAKPPPSQSPTIMPTSTSSPTLPSGAPSLTPSTSVPSYMPSATPTSQTPSHSPIEIPTNAIDLASWQVFYDALSGPQWLTCILSRDRPCDYVANGCNPATWGLRRIECNEMEQENRITGIKLVNNNLAGRVPVEAINAMTHLTVLDLSNNNLFNEQCLDLPFCYGGDALCLFDNTTVQLCPETGPPTGAPSVPGDMNPDDLDAWKILYDVTAGSTTWVQCQDSRLAPCVLCSELVNCTVMNGSLRITAMDLRRNGLTGNIPFDALNSLTALQVLDLSNLPVVAGDGDVGQDNEITTDGPCLMVQACMDPDVTCLSNNTAVEFCDSGGISITAVPTTNSGLDVKDLVAWQWFYDDTNGMQWETCAGYRDDPCACQVQGLVNVTCAGGHIVVIELPENMLRGAIHVEPLRFLMMNGLTHLDLSNPIDASVRRSNVLTAVAPQTCLDLPLCFAVNVFCSVERSGVDLCVSSSVSPTVTGSPSHHPSSSLVPTSTMHPTTLNPTTSQPHQTNKPTKPLLTLEPSASPVKRTSVPSKPTAHPTVVPTLMPVKTLHPTARPSNATITPTRPTRKTVAPTTVPTSRPSTVATLHPTARPSNATIAPTQPTRKTVAPTTVPTSRPSTVAPSKPVTSSPVKTGTPTKRPSNATATPTTLMPTRQPSRRQPTFRPVRAPTTQSPTLAPSLSPVVAIEYEHVPPEYESEYERTKSPSGGQEYEEITRSPSSEYEEYEGTSKTSTPSSSSTPPSSSPSINPSVTPRPTKRLREPSHAPTRIPTLTPLSMANQTNAPRVTDTPTIIDNGTVAPSAVGNFTLRPTVAGNGTSAPSAVGTFTLRPTVAGNGSTSAPSAVGNFTLRPTVAGNSTVAPSVARNFTFQPSQFQNTTLTPTIPGTKQNATVAPSSSLKKTLAPTPPTATGSVPTPIPTIIPTPLPTGAPTSIPTGAPTPIPPVPLPSIRMRVTTCFGQTTSTIDSFFTLSNYCILVGDQTSSQLFQWDRTNATFSQQIFNGPTCQGKPQHVSVFQANSPCTCTSTNPQCTTYYPSMDAVMKVTRFPVHAPNCHVHPSTTTYIPLGECLIGEGLLTSMPFTLPRRFDVSGSTITETIFEGQSSQCVGNDASTFQMSWAANGTCDVEPGDQTFLTLNVLAP